MHRWSRGVLGGVLLVVAAAGLWLVSEAGSAAGEGNAMLRVSPGSQNIAPTADPFKIDVTVSNVENLGAFDIALTFNKDVLEYIGIARGPFLVSSGRKATCIPPFPGPNGATATQNVNNNGALHFGCNTVGIVQDNVGKPGPSGSGTLMSIGFKPKAPGKADLAFRGFVNGAPYIISPPDGTYAGEAGSTSLGTVEVCSGAGGCADGLDIPFDMQGGVVQVIDPNAPEPTAAPPTPTVVPRGVQKDVRKTVEAVLGTPERFLGDGTPIPLAPDSAGGSSGGASSSVAGASSSSGGATGSVAGADNGGADGSTGDIAPDSPGAGGSRSASRTPRAGYGPDVQPRSPWPGRASLALALAGMGAIVAGAAGNRRGQRA